MEFSSVNVSIRRRNAVKRGICPGVLLLVELRYGWLGFLRIDGAITLV